MMKFDQLGIVTFGNVWAFISSFSPMIPLRLSRYAVTAYTSLSLSEGMSRPLLNLRTE